MKNKITVNFIGSNASGKSTQSKILHSQFKTKEKEIIKIFSKRRENDKLIDVYKGCYTDFGLIANLGNVNENQCSGTDTLSTKEQIEISYNKCIEDNKKIIVVDAIMYTGQWLKFLKNDQSYLLLVLLDFKKLEDNIERIINRRMLKNPDKNISLNQKTVDNISGKIRGFRSQFENAKKETDFSLKIDCMKSKEDINSMILSKIDEISKML